MSVNFNSSADHLDSATNPLPTFPATLCAWFKVPAANADRRILTLGKKGSDSAYLSLKQASTNAGLAAGSWDSHNTLSEAISNIPPSNVWNHGIANFAAVNSRDALLNGAHRVAVGATSNPAALDTVIVSGRADTHNSGIQGPAAHIALYGRSLAAIEEAYLGLGGHPRYLTGLVEYWRLSAAAATQVGEIGGLVLTATGTSTGSDDPAISTYRIGAPVNDFNLARNVAMAPADFSGLFENVNSAFTLGLIQLAAAVNTTTTVGTASTPTAVIQVTSTAGIAVGGYVQVGVGGTLALVLAISAGTGQLLLDRPITYAAGTGVFFLAASALAVAGLAFAGSVLSGTPTALIANPRVLVRATCVANNAVFADSNIFSFNVNTVAPGLLPRHRKSRRRVFVTTYQRR